MEKDYFCESNESKKHQNMKNVIVVISDIMTGKFVKDVVLLANQPRERNQEQNKEVSDHVVEGDS